MPIGNVCSKLLVHFIAVQRVECGDYDDGAKNVRQCRWME